MPMYSRMHMRKPPEMPSHMVGDRICGVVAARGKAQHEGGLARLAGKQQGCCRGNEDGLAGIRCVQPAGTAPMFLLHACTIYASQLRGSHSHSRRTVWSTQPYTVAAEGSSATG